MRPKKSLGQNFLRDKGILKKIADSAQINKGDLVVEVGPGEGTLTEILLKRASKVIAIEKDGKLAEFLNEKFREDILDNRLQIIVEDILDYNLKSNNYKLIGNIPYYITGALFKKIFESENLPKSITFVVQKEVAERIVAKDNKESILSVSIKAYGEPHLGGIIKAGSFSPRPKVDSAIIHINLTPLSPLNLRGGPDPKKFFAILKKGFAHKRKLLIKNLGVPKTVFDTCSIPEKARAEDLKVDDWFCLAKSFPP